MIDGEVVVTTTVLTPLMLFILKKVFDIDKRLVKVETKIETFLNGKVMKK